MGLLKLLLLVVVLANFASSQGPCDDVCSSDNCENLKQAQWSYCPPLPNGPENWKDIGYPDCGGNSQSPIRINSSDCKKLGKDQNIAYITGNASVTNGTITNNGYSLQIQLHDADNRYIIINETRYKYVSSRIHISSDCRNGTEHFIDEQFGDLEDEVNFRSSDGKNVLVSIIYKAGENKEDNPYLQSYVEALPKVQNNGTQTEFTRNLPNPFSSYLPYYSYEGSRSMPPCTEGRIRVVVAVFSDMSNAQLNAFRSVFSSEEGTNSKCPMAGNNRPPQPVNNRTVSCYSSSDAA